MALNDTPGALALGEKTVNVTNTRIIKPGQTVVSQPTRRVFSLGKAADTLLDL